MDFVGRPQDAFCLAGGPNIEQVLTYAMPNETIYSLFASAGAALVRAELFHEVGGFDPNYFIYHEDVDLCWRFWLRGYKCALSPASVTYHRGGAASRKLPPSYVQGLAQKHTLFTLFKNLDGENLDDLFPLVLYVLLERGQWLEDARASIPKALDEFHSSIDELVATRREIQTTRVVSDDQIFSSVGHPLAFLLSQERYRAIESELAALCLDAEGGVDTGSSAPARVAIARWVNAAHFLFERDLLSALHDSEAGLGALSRASCQLSERMTQKEEEVRQLASQVDTYPRSHISSQPESPKG